jgi:hypothetical protein
MRRLRSLATTLPLLLLAAAGAMRVPTAAGDEDPVRRDTTPPRLSLYLPIPLGVPGVEDSATGVFAPENYRAGRTIDPGRVPARLRR